MGRLCIGGGGLPPPPPGAADGGDGGGGYEKNMDGVAGATEHGTAHAKPNSNCQGAWKVNSKSRTQ